MNPRSGNTAIFAVNTDIVEPLWIWNGIKESSKLRISAHRRTSDPLDFAISIPFTFPFQLQPAIDSERSCTVPDLFGPRFALNDVDNNNIQHFLMEPPTSFTTDPATTTSTTLTTGPPPRGMYSTFYLLKIHRDALCVSEFVSFALFMDRVSSVAALCEFVGDSRSLSAVGCQRPHHFNEHIRRSAAHRTKQSLC